MDTSAVKLIDEAIIGMRKLWSPITSGRPASGSAPLVDLSSVLVVDAVSRLEGKPSIGQIAEHLSVAQTTASRIADKAVAAGFVTKQPAEDDVRRAELALTPQGQELLDRSLEFRYAYVRTLLQGWSFEEVETFSVLLSRFAATAADNPPDPNNPPPGVDARFEKGDSFEPTRS